MQHITDISFNESTAILSLCRKAMVIQTNQEIRPGHLLIMNVTTDGNQKLIESTITCVISDVQQVQPNKSGVFFVCSFHVCQQAQIEQQPLKKV